MSRETFRDAVERAMRDDGADDETIAAALARIGPPRAVYARVRDRRQMGRGRIDTDHGAEPLTPDGLDRLMRKLPGGANRGGRTDEREERLRDYAAAIAALSNAKYRAAQITARLVLAQLHRTGSEAQLRKDVSDPAIGGWQRFRAAVLQAR